MGYQIGTGEKDEFVRRELTLIYATRQELVLIYYQTGDSGKY